MFIINKKIKNVKEEITIDEFFEFYKKQGETLTDIKQFEQIFVQLCLSNPIINGKQISYESSVRKFLKQNPNH